MASNGSVNWQQLDEAFPTLVRYTGLILVIVLVVAGLGGYGLTVIAPGFVAATGMILFKTVKGAANHVPPRTDHNVSHLPPQPRAGHEEEG